jgi:UDPglucose 6-dehydrogenase
VADHQADLSGRSRSGPVGSDVAVIGAGYVGLTTAACLAHLGHRVVCADIIPERVESLARGEVPIVEQGLDQLVAEGLETGRLRFVLGAAEAARTSEFVYLSVPTPQGDDGAADLSFIEAAAREIGPVLPADAVVINKSTVPVGSTRVVERELRRADVYVVSNPEFLREGSAVGDFLEPDRVIIGSDDQSAAIRVAALYVGVPAPLMVTDPASAETIKYASNAFLATKLSFVNAVAAVCEAVGADVSDVVLGMGYDERIGHEFLRPGPGWGGSCFPKDSSALVRIAEEAGYDFGLLKGVIAVNDEQFDRVADKIEAMVGGDVAGKTVAVWGLTFKARTDDLRESPSLEIIARLIDRGAVVHAHDPTVGDAPDGDLWDHIEIGADPYAVCDGADVLAVLTEWDEYRWLDFDKVADAMPTPRCVDTRNLLERASLQRRGFDYVGIGRG